MKRVISFSIVAVSFLYLPWYMTALLAIISSVSVGRPFDLVIWAFLADIIYGPSQSIFGIPYGLSVISIILAPLLSAVRSRVSW
jgi:hypothetical protein